MRVFYHMFFTANVNKLNMATKQAKQKSKQSATKTKQKTPESWKWGNIKNEEFLEAAVAFKRQMLEEGMEWDSG